MTIKSSHWCSVGDEICQVLGDLKPDNTALMARSTHCHKLPIKISHLKQCWASWIETNYKRLSSIRPGIKKGEWSHAANKLNNRKPRRSLDSESGVRGVRGSQICQLDKWLLRVLSPMGCLLLSTLDECSVTCEVLFDDWWCLVDLLLRCDIFILRPLRSFAPFLMRRPTLSANNRSSHANPRLTLQKDGWQIHYRPGNLRI